jgi:hypothetical protein
MGAAAAVGLGFGVAAYASSSGPFHPDGHFSSAEVLSAMPVDFPMPPAAELRDAGAGQRLPYRVEWRSDARVSEVAGLMAARLDDGSWTLVEPSLDGDPSTAELRAARQSAGDPPFVAELRVSPRSGGSILIVEFSPLPASIVPGYDEWLASRGLVVHDVDPALIERR